MMRQTKRGELLDVADVHRVQLAGAHSSFQLSQRPQRIDRELVGAPVLFGLRNKA